MSTETSQLSGDQIAQLEQLLDVSNAMTEQLREQLSWNVMLAGEDIGWAKVWGNRDASDGPDIDQIKEWSRKMRDALGNVHMQRGLRLRTNNIWRGGIHYNLETLPDGSGHKVQTKKRVVDPLNQRNFFGNQAHAERESCLYTDGIYLVLGDPSDWTLEPIPFEEIGAVTLNPRRADEIIAYRHDYQDFTSSFGGLRVREWHYTDLANGRRNKPGFKVNVKNDEKSPDNRVIFDMHVNTQIGWAFGVPDSLTAFAWAKVYRDFVVSGKVMADALTQFAYQVTAATKKEAQNIAARIAEPSSAGSTLVGANALVPLSSAGRGYDFASGRPLLAIVAAAMEVSATSLSADTGSTGQAAETALDLPTRLAMAARQALHVDFDRRVLIWMGADPAKLEVTFSSLDDGADIYRELQALILALGSGLYEPEPIEKRISQLLEVTGNTIPDGYLIPNNLKSAKAQATLAPKPTPAAPGAPGAPKKSTAAPDQGRNNPAGKSDVKGNDIRTDNKTT